MYLDIERRVNNGMRFLDARQPGWSSKLDLSGLHIAGEQSCVLGQLRGAYSKGREELGLGGAAAIHLGFFASSGSESERALEYDLLTDAWVDVVAVRRAA
jgi:hypothetical protein